MFSLDKVTKQFETQGSEFRGIKDISFKVSEGEIICVLGGSGSGKSTLLKALAGLEKIDAGKIKYSSSEHQYSYVSQEYTLWPHLTVLENLILAPRLNSKRNHKDIKKEALSLLKRFGLQQYSETYSSSLSGGQRQRVAILRAIMNRPKILFLDEITSALDPELTKSVLDLIRTLAKDGYTMIIVTHHMSFAMSVANRIIFLKNGEVAQDDNPINFFTNQTDSEIKSFILDIARKDDKIEIFKGVEQFQAYHIGLVKRLPRESTIYVVGAVGDSWYKPMEDLYQKYEDIRLEKQITWKMVSYEQGEKDKQLERDFPRLNKFRKMPRTLQNPANYNVFGDTVITQIFDKEPTIIQVRNQNVADAYLRFFEELWELAK